MAINEEGLGVRANKPNEYSKIEACFVFQR